MFIPPIPQFPGYKEANNQLLHSWLKSVREGTYLSGLGATLERDLFVYSEDPEEGPVSVKVGERDLILLLTRFWETLESVTRAKSTPSRRACAREAFSHLGRLLRKNGAAYCVKYMKVSQFVLLMYLSGTKANTTRALGVTVRLRHGLPKFLGSELRSILRDRSHRHLRIWISVLNVYRVIQAEYPLPDLKNIMAPPPSKEEVEAWESTCSKYLPSFWALLGVQQSGNVVPALSLKDISPTDSGALLTSGPGNPVNLLGANIDLVKWTLQPRHLVHEYLTSIKETFGLTDFKPLTKLEGYTETAKLLLKTLDFEGHSLASPRLKPRWKALAKISLKYEPAGKVRCFAILDQVSQWALRPLHDWLYTMLEKVGPSDGTLSHGEAVRRLAQKSKDFACNADLSAATDLAPATYIQKVLEYPLGTRLSNAWKDLLVERVFLTPRASSLRKPRGGRKPPLALPYPNWVSYSRGQPMGAYTSWAAFSLMHHFMVYVAAREIGLTDYREWYTIVGDDVSILHRELAESYKRVCGIFGVTYNPHKTLQTADQPSRLVQRSGALVHFVQEVYLANIPLSPVSVRLFAHRGIEGRLELLRVLVERGYVGATSSGSEKSNLARWCRLILSPSQWRKALPLIRRDLVPMEVRIALIYVFFPLGPSALGAQAGKEHFKRWVAGFLPGTASWSAFTGQRFEEFDKLLPTPMYLDVMHTLIYFVFRSIIAEYVRVRNWVTKLQVYPVSFMSLPMLSQGRINFVNDLAEAWSLEKLQALEDVRTESITALKSYLDGTTSVESTLEKLISLGMGVVRCPDLKKVLFDKDERRSLKSNATILDRDVISYLTRLVVLMPSWERSPGYRDLRPQYTVASDFLTEYVPLVLKELEELEEST